MLAGFSKFAPPTAAGLIVGVILIVSIPTPFGSTQFAHETMVAIVPAFGPTPACTTVADGGGSGGMSGGIGGSENFPSTGTGSGIWAITGLPRSSSRAEVFIRGIQR